MKELIGLILFIIFNSIALIHIYWALGGKWANKAVIPSQDDNKEVKMPGPIPTLLVSLFLMAFSLIILNKALKWDKFSDYGMGFIDEYGLICLGVIFLIRAVGEFNYVGFFKKIKHTRFAKNDSLIYSPLCLVIALLIFFLEKLG